mmetsp:Transcript_11658/g.24346  ORF Transcript_11658/g.24346 Transcript_11658/m.24346 type:complete len:94 (-) Transcript_11658:1721-2002(-)
MLVRFLSFDLTLFFFFFSSTALATRFSGVLPHLIVMLRWLIVVFARFWTASGRLMAGAYSCSLHYHARRGMMTTWAVRELGTREQDFLFLLFT